MSLLYPRNARVSYNDKYNDAECIINSLVSHCTHHDKLLNRHILFSYNAHAVEFVELDVGIQRSGMCGMRQKVDDEEF